MKLTESQKRVLQQINRRPHPATSIDGSMRRTVDALTARGLVKFGEVTHEGKTYEAVHVTDLGREIAEK